jgi:hypothetical protein
MHRTRGVLIRNFSRRHAPGLDGVRLEIQLDTHVCMLFISTVDQPIERVTIQALDCC